MGITRPSKYRGFHVTLEDCRASGCRGLLQSLLGGGISSVLLVNRYEKKLLES